MYGHIILECGENVWVLEKGSMKHLESKLDIYKKLDQSLSIKLIRIKGGDGIGGKEGVED